MIPQWFAVPPVGDVVQDQKIADAFVEGIGDSIEFARQAFVDAAGFRRGQQPQHVLDSLLDEEQAGRLQRLEEAACEADADAVALPRFGTPAGSKTQKPGLVQSSPIQLA